MPKLSKGETETIIRWDREEKAVVLYTTDQVTIRRATKLKLSPIDEDGLGRWFRVPLDQFRWGIKRNSPKKGQNRPLNGQFGKQTRWEQGVSQGQELSTG